MGMPSSVSLGMPVPALNAAAAAPAAAIGRAGRSCSPMPWKMTFLWP